MHIAGPQSVLSVEWMTPWLSQVPTSPQCFPSQRHRGSSVQVCAWPDGFGKGTAAVSWALALCLALCQPLGTAIDLIVIDPELSPFYMWESECSNSSSWHFTRGSWGGASVAEVPSEQTWGHGFEPQNLPKVWTQWQICDPVHLQQEGQRQETLPKQMCGYPGVHIGRQHKRGPDKRLGHSWGCPLAYTGLSWQEHTPLTHARESMPRGHPPQTNQVWETLWVSTRKPRVVLLLLHYLSGLLVVS